MTNCEHCNRPIRISTLYTATKQYQEWITHNEEVKQSGMGAQVCWACWRKPHVQNSVK